MEKVTVPLTVAEYFAGIGLVRMGLEPYGWRVVFANDISEKKYEMYKAFFPDAEQHYKIGDVFELNPADISATMLATCSFPCIDLSLAGNMNGISGKHSSAFWGFVKSLKSQGDAAPPIILVENVPGWLYSNKGADFRLTVQALNELDYACDVFVLDALRFTPQSRQRVFLLGTKLPVSGINVNLLLQRQYSLTSESLRKSLIANQDLKWFYTELPTPPPLRKSGLSEIIEQMNDDDSRWWKEDEVKRHFDMMSKPHQQMVKLLIDGNRISYRTFYRRRRVEQQRAEVRPDDIAGCLRTAVGGSGKQFLIKAGGGQMKMRTMTPREYARLQGVPDGYQITVNGVQALTGFGDAVCVPVITWIAQHALNPLVEKHISQEEVPKIQRQEWLTI
ncbi:MAG TPA: DNA (cytosine-5-)-methyltransferase [Candidatus Brocadiaceae bacterium]|nr:DNA (cytosine-5-)-methyltransferase [Candidatus Brocadiaceae bacterium]